MESTTESEVNKTPTVDTQPESKTEETPEKMAEPVPQPEFIIWQVLAQIVAALVFMAVNFYGILDGCISLHPHADEVYIDDFVSKLEFLTKYQAPNIAFIVILVYYVIAIRVRNPRAANPLSGNEHIVQKGKNILTNTVEQYLIYLVVQLMLINYIDGQMVVKIVPFMCWCFFIGRVTFAIGYPFYRDFGLMLNLVPNLLALLYCCCKFVNFIDVVNCVNLHPITHFVYSLINVT